MSQPSVNRREFLNRVSSATLAAGAATLLPALAGAAEKHPTIGLGCRDVLLKLTDQPDCWAAMKAVGATCVESDVSDDLSLPGLYHPQKKYSLATPASIAELRTDLQASGQRISAFCMHNRFDQRPEFELEWGAKVAQAAHALAVRAIRIDIVPRKPAGEGFLDFAVDIMKKLIAATAASDARFAVENHGNTTNNPDFLRALFERVGSPRLGLTLDTGNFYWYGHPLSKVYDYFAILAPRVFHTHCKSIRYPESEREKTRKMGWEYAKYNCPVYEGDIDFARVAKILRTAGYNNDLCVENESLKRFPAEERGKIVAREIRFLADAWNKAG